MVVDTRTTSERAPPSEPSQSLAITVRAGRPGTAVRPVSGNAGDRTTTERPSVRTADDR